MAYNFKDKIESISNIKEKNFLPFFVHLPPNYLNIREFLLSHTNELTHTHTLWYHLYSIQLTLSSFRLGSNLTLAFDEQYV